VVIGRLLRLDFRLRYLRASNSGFSGPMLMALRSRKTDRISDTYIADAEGTPDPPRCRGSNTKHLCSDSPRTSGARASTGSEYPFLERFDRAAAAGFEAVEFPEPYGRTCARSGRHSLAMDSGRCSSTCPGATMPLARSASLTIRGVGSSSATASSVRSRSPISWAAHGCSATLGSHCRTCRSRPNARA
jgi:hypothetical protein